MVIKRNGDVVLYDHKKMYKVALWACDGSTIFADQLMEAITIKIHNKIRIEKLYDEVISTASNLISDMYPHWEKVARNLLKLKLHKETGVKRAQYPDYESVVLANESVGNYDVRLLDELSGLGIYRGKLAEAIDPSYDDLFTFGGLDLFVQKYCNKNKGKLLELPQHVYMRVAIQLMYKDGTQAIIAKYHQLASHSVTEATPKMVNSLKENAQSFSCCLARPEDTLESINGVDDMLGRESKFGGGLSEDYSAVRAPGAIIEGNKGVSGGVIPIIQGTQWAVGRYNQGSTRSMALAAYYNWFHYQSPEITELKSESGKDENRARKLKYAIKWNSTLSDAIRNNEDIYLIDPHKTQDMTYAWGQEWKDLYEKYSKNTRIRKRKYSARELAFSIAKVSLETGNLYKFFTDNANIQNIGAGVITQSNLCTEYMPNFEAVHHIEDDLINSDKFGTYMNRMYSGDIALCNLSSINVMRWAPLSPAKKEEFMYLLVRSMDNAIDNSFYSNPLGKKHSEEHRNIGIGMSNYANYIASNECLWNSEKARKLTHELQEEISYYAIKASVRLASERGKFPLYDKSRWSEGIFPHELSILGNSDSELNYQLRMDWESLRVELIRFGIRNEYLLAIAPTATSSLAINATEGTDMPRQLKTIKEGTYSIPFVVPNLRQNREFYQTTFQIANKDTIELAAIRQKFICMSQPVSLAYPNPDSAYDVIDDIMYAEELGLKSIYYTHSQVQETEEGCDSCGS